MIRRIPDEIKKPFEVNGTLDYDKASELHRGVERNKVIIKGVEEIIQRGGSVTRVSKTKDPRFKIEINKRQPKQVLFSTLIHELAHIFCGHLGSQEDECWNDRRFISIKSEEFEAESVCFLVLSRIGLKSKASNYLAGYVEKKDQIPPISIEHVVKTVEWIEKLYMSKKVNLFD